MRGDDLSTSFGKGYDKHVACQEMRGDANVNMWLVQLGNEEVYFTA